MTIAAASPRRRWLTILTVLALVMALLASAGNAQPSSSDIFVAPGASGAGTLADPASLSATLESRSIAPGTTIWLRGGVYEEGPFDSNSDGTSAEPIVVRPYPGEHAVIDGNQTHGVAASVTINGDWQTWRDLEFTNSAPERFLITTLDRLANLAVHGVGTALINNEIHDGGVCLGWWKAAQNSLVYGNLIYNCGHQSSDRGHGHGVYIQNNDGGRKTFEHNLVGSTYGRSIHIYGSDRVHDVDMVGNVFAGGTSLASELRSPVYIAADIQDLQFRSNHVYTLQRSAVSIVEADRDVVVSDNWMMTRGDAVAGLWIRSGDPISGSGNHISSDNRQVQLEPGVSLGSWDGNTYHGPGVFSPGTTFAGWQSQTGSDASSSVVGSDPTHIEVTPNRYDGDRAMVTVWNGAGASSVGVDLSDILEPGDRYEILSGQDLGGTPLVTGTFDGGSVTIPFTSRPVGAPIGGDAPEPWGLEFGTFLVRGQGPEPIDDPGGEPGPSDTPGETPTCQGRAATIVARPGIPTVGTDGPDVIVGTSGPDEIRGRAGDDVICGRGGRDIIHGNEGDDTIHPGKGRDTVRAGKGDDRVLASSGGDTIWGQTGRDDIRGGTGGDNIRGGSGADVIRGGKGADRLRGGSGGDTVAGNSGVDDCGGGAGRDVLLSCP
ncbi:MAG: hypothetical protein AAF480_19165 [Actinomycetota bacterium]